jgi:NADH-quinone oxidoreductase subunit J
MEAVAFFAGAIGALGGAIAVIALRNPFYSVLALIVHLVSLAGLFLILHAEFVAAAQVVVYAGAVMVLYVFVAAYVGGVQEPAWEPIPGQQFLAPLLGGALFIELSIAVLGSSLKALDTNGPTIQLGFGSPADIGRALLERFLVAFEATSMLLLLAAVGAIVLAGRRRGGAVGGDGGTPSERFASPGPRRSEAPGVTGPAASEEGGGGGPTPRPSTPGPAY